ncbi:MAG: ABC transporter permease subunit [Rhodobacteraceae bacterium]|nr:ABC transporter permease subunit [Paracoccaceae bacterium]
MTAAHGRPARAMAAPGVRAALVALLAGALCLALAPRFAWLGQWPDAWTLPLTQWAGTAVTWLLEAIKPLAREFSALMRHPMDWANLALHATPWPITIGVTAALGWYLGGFAMAALGAVGLGFVVASGYWTESMNTLALVAVSVPLALVVGGAIGILANEMPRLKPPVQALLDVMQTVPTFAYLTPLMLLFGFGPVVGLIASAIYAAPPMARNVLLALERVDPEIREAAVMSGATRAQQLFQVEIPSGASQIMVGVNQCLMAALSMVIIAAVIGGFNDIGWEVLLTMRKAQFGQSLLAGLVIVVFAVVIDRYSGTLAGERRRHDRRVVYLLLALSVVLTALFWSSLADAATFHVLTPVAEAVDRSLTAFTIANGATLDAIKNNAMFFGLLPLRIGLDQAVLPFTWGFAWTGTMSWALFAVAAVLCLLLIWRGRPAAGLMAMIAAGMLETGIADLPWPFVLIGTAALGWVAAGWRLALLSLVLLSSILLSGLFGRALMSLYLSGAAVFACALVGGAVGWLAAVSPLAWRLVRPLCDMLQTIPLFVFLIPVLMFFQIGEFSAFLAICAYAVVPMIRYTRHGLVSTPPDLIEAAAASGATDAQIMRDIRVPYAAPTILLGLNQTILYAFAMLVIAALIGTTGLGQSIYLALGQADVGLGVSAGAAMAILALLADRIVQGFAAERQRALGL